MAKRHISNVLRQINYLHNKFYFCWMALVIFHSFMRSIEREGECVYMCWRFSISFVRYISNNSPAIGSPPTTPSSLLLYSRIVHSRRIPCFSLFYLFGIETATHAYQICIYCSNTTIWSDVTISICCAAYFPTSQFQFFHICTFISFFSVLFSIQSYSQLSLVSLRARKPLCVYDSTQKIHQYLIKLY